MKKEILNPPALGAPPRFYSHAVAFEGPAKLVYVSGQVSMDEDGKVVAAGGGWDDVIKMTGFMVGLNAQNVAAYREGRSAHFNPKRFPASTRVGASKKPAKARKKKKR